MLRPASRGHSPSHTEAEPPRLEAPSDEGCTTDSDPIGSQGMLNRADCSGSLTGHRFALRVGAPGNDRGMSGRTILLAAALTVVNRYPVCMPERAMLRNIRFAVGKPFIRSGGRKSIQCEEVAVDRRAPILKADLPHAPGARAHVPCRIKDVPVTDFERNCTGLSGLSCRLSCV
jgi:hypothetical protein